MQLQPVRLASATSARRPVRSVNAPLSSEDRVGLSPEAYGVQQAVAALQRGFAVADTAGQGGSGDGKVSMQDLQALLAGSAAPDLKAAAAFFAGDEVLFYAMAAGDSWITPDELEAAAAQLVGSGGGLGHQNGAEGRLEMRDGQPVWSDTGQPLTASEYQDLLAQLEGELPLVDGMLAAELQEVHFNLLDRLEALQGRLADASAAIEQESAHFAQFMLEYGDLLTEDDKTRLTAEFQGRLDALQAPLEQAAAEFVALAEDPLFLVTFSAMSPAEQQAFFRTVADSVGNTAAGSAFAQRLMREVAALPAEQSSPYAQVAQQLIEGGQDIKTFQDAFAVLGARELLNGGDPQTFIDVSRAVHGEEAAQLAAQMVEQLQTAAASGQDAYQTARTQAMTQLNQSLSDRPAVLEFLAAGALAVDAYLIGQNGFEQLKEPGFALQVVGDAADTGSLLLRAVGVGPRATQTLGKVSTGVGVLLGAVDLGKGIAEGDEVRAISGTLAVVGSGLLLAGLGGPVGPILLAGSLAVTFLPALFEEDPYADYVDDRFADAELSTDLYSFTVLAPEARQEVARMAEEWGLPAAQVAALAMVAVAEFGVPQQSVTAAQIREWLGAALIDPTFGPSAGDSGDFWEVQQRTGLEPQELLAQLGELAAPAYQDYLLAHPDEVLTLRQYVDTHMDELLAAFLQV